MLLSITSARNKLGTLGYEEVYRGSALELGSKRISRFSSGGVMRTVPAILLSAAAFLVLAPRLVAQPTASVVGAVADPSGAVIPGASITATEKGTGLKRAVRSNEHGVYVVSALPVGTYAISVEAAGFKHKTLTGIVLQVNQEA